MPLQSAAQGLTSPTWYRPQVRLQHSHLKLVVRAPGQPPVLLPRQAASGSELEGLAGAATAAGGAHPSGLCCVLSGFSPPRGLSRSLGPAQFLGWHHPVVCLPLLPAAGCPVAAACMRACLARYVP